MTSRENADANRKVRLLLGRAVINGHMATAVHLQSERLLSLCFIDGNLRRDIDKKVMPHIIGETYLLLMAANQFAMQFEPNKRPKLQTLKEIDIAALKLLRNNWEHGHPLKSRLRGKASKINKQNRKILEKFPELSKLTLVALVIEPDDIKIANFVSVKKLLEESKFWMEVAEEFDSPDFVLFPSSPN